MKLAMNQSVFATTSILRREAMASTITAEDQFTYRWVVCVAGENRHARRWPAPSKARRCHSRPRLADSGNSQTPSRAALCTRHEVPPAVPRRGGCPAKAASPVAGFVTPSKESLFPLSGGSRSAAPANLSGTKASIESSGVHSPANRCRSPLAARLARGQGCRP